MRATRFLAPHLPVGSATQTALLWAGNALLLSENRKVWREPREMRGDVQARPWGLMPPERARRPEGGGAPAAAGRAAGKRPMAGVHGGGSVRPTQWRGPAPEPT